MGISLSDTYLPGTPKEWDFRMKIQPIKGNCIWSKKIFFFLSCFEGTDTERKKA